MYRGYVSPSCVQVPALERLGSDGFVSIRDIVMDSAKVWCMSYPLPLPEYLASIFVHVRGELRLERATRALS